MEENLQGINIVRRETDLRDHFCSPVFVVGILQMNDLPLNILPSFKRTRFISLEEIFQSNNNKHFSNRTFNDTLSNLVLIIIHR